MAQGERIRGSIYDDKGYDTGALHGTIGQDTIFGLEGNDELYGWEDHDRLYGGDYGNDTLYGYSGNDTLHGDDNNDFLFVDILPVVNERGFLTLHRVLLASQSYSPSLSV